MAEKWESYYTKNQLDLLQKIEIENLKVFIDVCEKLQLEYVIYGGTLLGAEKFQGMVPWDDDIDVALPRDSYEKFCRRASEVLPSDYLISCPYNDRITPFPYAKMIRKGTIFTEYIDRNLPLRTGIYIDIYPIDKIPCDEKKRKAQFRRVRRWLFIYVCRQRRLYDKRMNGINKVVGFFARWIICHLSKLFSQRYCIKKINSLMTKYNNSQSSRYAALNSPNYNNIYERLYPLKTIQFEGMDVFAPNDYREHLKRRYGDYSGLPSEEMRYGHAPYILDFGTLEEKLNNELK